jgi:hypothetical protein
MSTNAVQRGLRKLAAKLAAIRDTKSSLVEIRAARHRGACMVMREQPFAA